MECNVGNGLKISLRDAALLGILFGCGPRRAEVVTIDINKINFSDRSIKVIGKGNKERELEMPPRTIDLVKTWLEESGLQFGPLFRPVNRWNEVAEDRQQGEEQDIGQFRHRLDPPDVADEEWAFRGVHSPRKASG